MLCVLCGLRAVVVWLMLVGGYFVCVYVVFVVCCCVVFVLCLFVVVCVVCVWLWRVCGIVCVTFEFG